MRCKHSKGGKPAVNNKEYYLELLSNYAIKNPGIMIKISDLVKEYKIERHYWKYWVKDEIKLLNDKLVNVVLDNSKDLPLPNIESIVEKNFKNKKALVLSLKSLESFIQELYNKARLFDKQAMEIKELYITIEELKQKVDYYRRQSQYYENEYKKLIDDSTSLKKRKEKRIRENVINISNRINEIVAGEDAIKKMYPGLFGSDE